MSLRLLAILVNILLYHLFWSKVDLIWHWRLSNTKILEFTKKTPTKMAMLSSHKGVCLDMEKRCDRRKDCSDGSDEKDCLMVHRSWETAKNILRNFYLGTQATTNCWRQSQKLEAKGKLCWWWTWALLSSTSLTSTSSPRSSPSSSPTQGTGLTIGSPTWTWRWPW